MTTLFVKHQQENVTTLIVYVDYIVVIDNDQHEIINLKSILAKEFEIKDLGHLKYFLGIEVVRSKKNAFLSQRKYVLNLFQDFNILRCKPCKTSIESNHRL